MLNQNSYPTMLANSYQEASQALRSESVTSEIKNGIWTVHNTVKGTHRTFKIHTAKNGRFGNKRFVSLLVGSDNENNYEGFAFVGSDGKSINVWHANRKNQDGSDSDFVKFAAILVDLFCNDAKKYGKFCELKGSTTCLRCNRTLSTPSSIDNRYGKECASKMLNF